MRLGLGRRELKLRLRAALLERWLLLGTWSSVMVAEDAAKETPKMCPT